MKDALRCTSGYLGTSASAIQQQTRCQRGKKRKEKETRKAQELGESQAQGLVNSEARGARGMRRQNPAPLKARTAVRSLERNGAKQLYRDVQLGPR